MRARVCTSGFGTPCGMLLVQEERRQRVFGSPEPEMPFEEEGAAMGTRGQPPSAGSVGSAVFGSVESPTTGVTPSSLTLPPAQFSLHQHAHRSYVAASTRPGNTSAGPPVLIASSTTTPSFTTQPSYVSHSGCDSRPGSAFAGPTALVPDTTSTPPFSMQSNCTFHTGCDSRPGLNNTRSRSALRPKRRKSTRSTTKPSDTAILHAGRDAGSVPLWQNINSEHYQNTNASPGSLHGPHEQQRPLGKFTTQLTGANADTNTVDLTMDMDTNC